MRKLAISMLVVGWAGVAEAKREIRISTVDQLYDEVNCARNAETRLVLAPPTVRADLSAARGAVLAPTVYAEFLGR